MNVLKSSALEMCGIYDLLLLSLWASSLLYYAHAYVLSVLVSKSNGDWFSSSISLPQVFFSRQQWMKKHLQQSKNAL